MVEELIRNGVEYFCIAPGSRSSPLTVAVARHAKAQSMVHFDERGLAFHALGYVMAAKKPAVIICTSGTAVANFLPAVVEASKKKIPLIVLTADRPPELRQTGAVQTIDQVHMFGKYALWHCDMPCPDLSIKPEFVLTTIDQAFYQSVRNRGVVHLNCMYREPLAPTPTATPWGTYLGGITRWQKSKTPYTTYVTNFEGAPIFDPAPIVQRIDAIKNGIIAVGKLSGEAEAAQILGFARRLHWPVFPDVSSGLRLGHSQEGIIHYFDQILSSSKAQAKITVDGIVHFGGRLTSKRFYDFVERKAPTEYITALNHALRADPLHKVSLRLECAPAQFCEQVGPQLKGRPAGALYKSLVKANDMADAAIEKFFIDDERLCEPRLARLVSQMLPKGSGLFLANSLPVREADMYADYKGPAVQVAGNRGASGIDGTIAAAAGFARGLKKPVTLMIGDLATLHDLNSLAILKAIDEPFVAVVINNGGGGIFSFLPIAGFGDVFEKFYGTPHSATFANAAAMFELQYARPQSARDFAKAYAKAIKSKTATIIEVMTGREENVLVHRKLQELLAR